VVLPESRVARLPQANQVAIFRGHGAAGFNAPTHVNSGASNPIVVASGNVMAGPFVDLVIGHADGTLTFFEGSADGSFVNRVTLPSVAGSTRREEISAPILNRLGYTASGPNRIIRSRNLTHPFVSIGTQQRKINIIPDYLLCIESKNALILDAKAPTQILRNSVHVEQAYSYAIHPEVRVPIYSLCNGREIVVYQISELEPIFECQLESIADNWDNLNAVIGPIGIQNPHLRDFLPDFGIRAKMSGVPPETRWVFMNSPLDNFTRVDDDLLTTFAKLNDNGTAANLWS
jgi:hypothetical protein